jgi:S1-C subfamily serine protease
MHITCSGLATLVFLLVAQPMLGQQAGTSAFQHRAEAPPPNMFLLTHFLKVNDEYGTSFVIDYKGHQYLVTAKHMVKGLTEEGGTIQVFRDYQWRDFTVDVIHCKSPDVDAVALKFKDSEKLTTVEPVEVTRETGTLGEPIFFFGYPHGLHTIILNGLYGPVVKHGVASAGDSSDKDAMILYFDAFNNKGFSGGPIVKFDTKTQRWRIFAVVSGYLPEHTRIKTLRGQDLESEDLVNSGIMAGYPISYLLDAIDAATQAVGH